MKSLLFWQPQLIGENAYAYWISKDEFVVAPNALVIEGVLGRKVVYKSSIQDPPIVKQIRAGWKVLEGTHMLVINDEDPYWQTEEGLIERPPKIDTGIEYAPETVPGADPKIVPDLTPELDKPPCDPNPPPKLDDPSVLLPVDPG